jgi:hypothetical protein
MEVSKRKVNGNSSTNGHREKKKIKKINEEEDLETTYFQSEIVYHSTVTKMKVCLSFQNLEFEHFLRSMLY